MRLYQLGSANYALQNIERQRLKVSRIDNLNDPFELLGAMQRDKHWRRIFRQAKTRIHNQDGVLCFSRSWRNPVLWSHYGDKHRGICLGFPLDRPCSDHARRTLTMKPVAAKRGDMIIWHHLLPHGSSPNRAQRPRAVQYMSLRPTRFAYTEEWKS
jgi:hypothetical protein